MDLIIGDGKLREVKGMVEDPETRGCLCDLGKSLPEVILSEQRIQTPLKRIGQKGRGEFVKISWEEALSTISQRWIQIIQEDGAHAIACYLGTTVNMDPYFLIPRLMYALGSPNIFLPEELDESAWAWAGKLTVGSFPSKSFEQWDKTSCITLWGHNPDASSPCSTPQWVREQRKRGCKLIVIDPQKIPLAEEADEWLPIRPGTDGALAWSMAQLIIQENLLDSAFIEKWTGGFRGFKEIALREEYQAEKVAELCGIQHEQIKRTARLFAQHSPSLLLGGSGVSQHGSGLQNSRAIHCLNLLTGNVNKPGSNLYYSYPLEPGTGFASLKERVENTGVLDKQLVKLPLGHGDSSRLWDILIASGDDLYWKDYIFRNARSEGRYPYNATDVYATGYQGKAYPLKSLMVIESDPLRELPGGLKGEMGLQKLPFLVVVAPFLNETTRYADIVLPSTISPESANFVSCHRPLSSQYLRLRKKAIAPQGESTSSHTIICNLAYLMGVGKLFDFTEGAFANMIFRSSPFTRTLSYQDLEASPLPLVPLYQVRELFPHPYRKNFDTPSGKALFASNLLAQLGFNPYPEWHPPLESKSQTPAFFSKYPLILVTGRVLGPKTSVGKAEVLINPQDARDHGITAGMDVWVESKINKIKRKAVISEDIAQGMVWTAKLLSALIPASTGKVNSVNHLIDDQHNDPIAGAPRFNEMLVKVYPA
jgi:anaerobic selenocysteine-containing dehydrogenase